MDVGKATAHLNLPASHPGQLMQDLELCWLICWYVPTPQGLQVKPFTVDCQEVSQEGMVMNEQHGHHSLSREERRRGREYNQPPSIVTPTHTHTVDDLNLRRSQSQTPLGLHPWMPLTSSPPHLLTLPLALTLTPHPLTSPHRRICTATCCPTAAIAATRIRLQARCKWAWDRHTHAHGMHTHTHARYM